MITPGTIGLPGKCPLKKYSFAENNFSDLEEKYSWCLNNNEKCEYISKNATNYMKQFLDINKEREIEREVVCY